MSHATVRQTDIETKTGRKLIETRNSKDHTEQTPETGNLMKKGTIEDHTRQKIEKNQIQSY
jgi:hypothetical protein